MPPMDERRRDGPPLRCPVTRSRGGKRVCGGQPGHPGAKDGVHADPRHGLWTEHGSNRIPAYAGTLHDILAR